MEYLSSNFLHRLLKLMDSKIFASTLVARLLPGFFFLHFHIYRYIWFIGSGKFSKCIIDATFHLLTSAFVYLGPNSDVVQQFCAVFLEITFGLHNLSFTCQVWQGAAFERQSEANDPFCNGSRKNTRFQQRDQPFIWTLKWWGVGWWGWQIATHLRRNIRNCGGNDPPMVICF